MSLRNVKEMENYLKLVGRKYKEDAVVIGLPTADRLSRAHPLGVIIVDTQVGDTYKGDGVTLGGIHTSSLIDTQWDDLRSSATAINPPGQVSDPDREATSGLLLFDATGTELIYVFHQMSHGWKYGTDIHPHIHWAKTTSAAGDVAWRCRYKMYPIGEVGDTDWTDLGVSNSTTDGTTDNDTANEHLITDFGSIDMTGYGLSDCILYEITRVGGDVLDTYGADARLLEFDTHYQIDKHGSDDEFTN